MFLTDGAGSPSSAPSSPVTVSSEDMNGTVKSEISLIHEMALRLGKTVKFEVIHESGPPHMRNFVTRLVSIYTPNVIMCECGLFLILYSI